MKCNSRICALLLCVVALCSCSNGGKTENQYIEWLLQESSYADTVSHPRSYWEANVEKSLLARRSVKWSVPEDIFLHFVLPVRVNNEHLDDFRILHTDALLERTKGMSLYQAALEVNHWCHEWATYRPSDSRTRAPLATMKEGFGRCGEESVLAVAALRASGIPARQVYTPRWAHTDDNHAWVEVWTDGQWQFLGACEPEPKLNMAWFNAPVSRAMLLHTKVFGDYRGKENVISRRGAFTEINVTQGYVATRQTNVVVKDTLGNAVEGASVEFKIYNYAEFFTVARYKTGEDGRSSLVTGCGDMLVWASKGNLFGWAVARTADGEADCEVVLNRHYGQEITESLVIEPPVENPIASGATESEIAENAARLAREDAIREARDHSNADLEAFLKRRIAGTQRLVDLLSEKDRSDVTLPVLEDALAGARGLDPYLLSPRVSNEELFPHREEILSSGIDTLLKSPEQIVDWVRGNILLNDEGNPQRLRIPPLYVWRSRIADSFSRDIFFVALARTLGLPARINEVTGIAEYLKEGLWYAANLAGDEDSVKEKPEAPASLHIEYAGNGVVKEPKYYRHFTLSSLTSTDGVSARLLEFGSDADDTPLSSLGGEIELSPGYYLLTGGTRMASGGVMVTMRLFNLESPLAKANVELVLPLPERELAVIGSMDAEQRFLPKGQENECSILSATGRGYFVVAVAGERDEPSNHMLSELRSFVPELEESSLPLLLLGLDECLRCESFGKVIMGADKEGKVLKMLCKGCERNSLTLPVVSVCDTFGRIVYFSQGYNTSLASDLADVLRMLK